MIRILKLLSFLVLLVTLIISSRPAQAQVGANINPSTVDETTFLVEFTFSGLVPGEEYKACAESKTCSVVLAETIKANADGQLSIQTCGRKDVIRNIFTRCDINNHGHVFTAFRNHKAVLIRKSSGNVVSERSFSVQRYYPNITLSPGTSDPDGNITVSISGNRRLASDGDRNTYDFDLKGVEADGTEINPSDPGDITVPDGETAQRTFSLSTNGIYTLKVYYNDESHNDKNILKTFSITRSDEGVATEESESLFGELGTNPCKNNECETALGPIPTNPQDFVTKILQIATGLAGGIALIIMVIGSVKVLTSSGDPQKVASGRDMIVAALAGVLFLIFSVLILRFIGFNILGLT